MNNQKPATRFVGSNPFSMMEIKIHKPQPQTKPKTKTKPKPKKTISFLDTKEISVTNDALPVYLQIETCKYQEIFTSMKPGQSIRCKAQDVGKVASAMRSFVRLNAKENLKVKTTVQYENDTGYGRVWMVCSVK